VVADQVFGPDNFQSEIIWQRVTTHSDARRFAIIHDVIMHYSKGSEFVWNKQFKKHDEKYLLSHYASTDPDGRRYTLDNASATGQGQPRKFGDRILAPPTGTHWRWSQDRINQLMAQGRIVLTSEGRPRFKRYLDESQGALIGSIWTDIPPVNSQAIERLGFPTQKPEALLARIISASSNQDDLVLDCFCGSGTTVAVAEKLGRRWIACDLSRFAIHTTRKRLLGVDAVKRFVIQNLGKYERQAWQSAEFGNESGERVRAYIDFILRLYSAKTLGGYLWIHGLKGKRVVHVGSVDSPISPLDVGQIVAEFRRLIGTGQDAPATNGVDVLGWDFAFELNELAKQQAAQASVDVRFLRIPHQVLDKQAVEQGDVHFFELASLDARVKMSGMEVTISIKDFVIPADDVPADVQKEIKHWSQWVDYWAIDWDYKDDTFHNEWQEYRTRDEPDLATEASKTYGKHGEYHIVVKVIDILGNDTTKLLSVKV